MTGLDIKIEAGDVKPALDATRIRLARRIRTGLERAARDAVLGPLRDDVETGLRSERLANTWRLKIYPSDRQIATLDPAALVFSKAPQIVTAFEDGATIAALAGKRYLWIPTENVPRTTGGKRLDPFAVARRVGKFGFAKARNGNIVAYAYVKSSSVRVHGGRRRRSMWTRLKKGEEGVRIAFFVLARQVTLKKRLNRKAIVRDAMPRWRVILTQEISRAG